MYKAKQVKNRIKVVVKNNVYYLKDIDLNNKLIIWFSQGTF